MDGIKSMLSMLNALRLLENATRNIDEKNSKELFSLNFKLLCSVYRLGSPTQSEVVKDIMLAKSNVAIFAKKLIEQGLLATRSDDNDKRIVYYILTKNGKNYVESVLDKASAILDCLPQTKADKFQRNITSSENLLIELEKESRNS